MISKLGPYHGFQKFQHMTCLRASLLPDKCQCVVFMIEKIEHFGT